MISIDGNKVATFPIEHRIEQQLRVTGVCVFAAPDAAGVDELHVVIESRTPVPAPALSWLAAAFATFASVRVHRMDALPRNDMGKVERLALRRALALDLQS